MLYLIGATSRVGNSKTHWKEATLSVKIVIFILFVPNKHIKRFAKLVAIAVIRTGKIAIKKAIKRLLNWLDD